MKKTYEGQLAAVLEEFVADVEALNEAAYDRVGMRSGEVLLRAAEPEGLGWPDLADTYLRAKAVLRGHPIATAADLRKGLAKLKARRIR